MCDKKDDHLHKPCSPHPPWKRRRLFLNPFPAGEGFISSKLQIFEPPLRVWAEIRLFVQTLLSSSTASGPPSPLGKALLVANYRFSSRLLKWRENRYEGCQDPSLRSRMRAQVPRMQAFVAESASFNLRGSNWFSTNKMSIVQSSIKLFCLLFSRKK